LSTPKKTAVNGDRVKKRLQTSAQLFALRVAGSCSRPPHCQILYVHQGLTNFGSIHTHFLSTYPSSGRTFLLLILLECKLTFYHSPGGKQFVLKAVIDIDGTLVDTVDFHAESWQKTFPGHQIPYEQIRLQIGKGVTS